MIITGIAIENGFIGITRLILLDSMLICFTSWTMLGYSTFRNQGMKPFGLKWWLALVATGFGIGCVSSVKWVGFLVTALVGLLTIEELWGMLGDIKMSKVSYFVRDYGIYLSCLDKVCETLFGPRCRSDCNSSRSLCV